MYSDEEKEIAMRVLKAAHNLGTLQHLIGDALGKNAVVVVLIDVIGDVTIHADNRARLDSSIRDRSMILQMTQLLFDNMKDMMQKAGKEARDAESGSSHDH